MAPTKVLGRQRQIVLVTGAVVCCLALLANVNSVLRSSREKPAIQVVVPHPAKVVVPHTENKTMTMAKGGAPRSEHTTITMEKEWVRHGAVSRNTTAARVLVMQTCGPGKYEELLKATRLANERWAGQQGYDYLSVVGNYAARHFQHGGREALSRFNKAWMVAEIMNMSSYDYVFYMDADAMVTDPLWDVRTLPSSLQGMMFQAHAGGGGPPWNINDGVMLWDLRHPHAADVVFDWVARSVEAIKAAGKEEPYFSDQALLKHALRDKLHSLGLPKNKTQETLDPQVAPIPKSVEAKEVGFRRPGPNMYQQGTSDMSFL